MARSIILGNSGLTVGLDEHGLVHDFYYPYVGLENLTTARMQPHHVGIWVDGDFSWINDGSWEGNVDFESTELMSKIDLLNDKLGLKLHFRDFVDANHDVFGRQITITNLTDKERDVRVFFHQVFQISALGRADTVMFVPEGPYMMDYKGRVSLLAYAENEDGEPFDQFAAGNAGIEGKEGTFRDAEDGELSMSAVEHGGVDSTIRVSLRLVPATSTKVRYWIAVSDNQLRLEKLHNMLLKGGFQKRMHATTQHWHDWLDTATSKISHLEDKYQTAIKKSLLVIKAHTDEHGGIIASCDSSIYNYGRDYYSYVWPRDGAYVMWPLIKLGYDKEPRAFLEFCKSIITPEGYLMHKYQPDRAVGSTWHPLVHGKRTELAIQEDETAIVMIILAEYYRATNDKKFVFSMVKDFVIPAGDFLASYIDDKFDLAHASYDLWEEKFLSTTYTNATKYRALLEGSWLLDELEVIYRPSMQWRETARNLKLNSSKLFNENEGYYIKGFLINEQDITIDSTLDISSFYGAWKYTFGEEKLIKRSLEAIEEKLLDSSPSGGSPRYENDNYFKSDPSYMGNPWFVTTLWLAQYYAVTGEIDRAKHYIDWSIQHTLPSGVLSEQITPEDGRIVGVTPLVWSHAELVNAILDIREH